MTQLWSFFDGFLSDPSTSLALLFILIVVATFVLEDPTTLAVGVLLGKGKITLAFALGSLFLGIFLGDFGLYLFGQCVRRGFFRNRRWSFQPSGFELFMARFVPGMRTITFSSAGFFQYPLGRFVVIGLCTSGLWTALLLSSTNYIVSAGKGLPWWSWVCIALGLMAGVRWIRIRVKRYVSDRQAKHQQTP